MSANKTQCTGAVKSPSNVWLHISLCRRQPALIQARFVEHDEQLVQAQVFCTFPFYENRAPPLSGAQQHNPSPSSPVMSKDI